MELTAFLQKESPEPLYSQLYHYIKTEIEEGKLAHGTKMPSIRQLSSHLRVSRNTVEAAYQQLQSEGYLESIPKSGIWVAEIDNIFLSSSEREHPNSFEPTQSHDVIVNFEYGNVDVEKFPLKRWKKCLNDAIDQYSNWLFEYGDKQGEYELRKEISMYLLQSRGVRAAPEQIVVTAGTQASIAFICQLLALRGKIVAMEEPGYSGVRVVLEDQGCQIEPIPLEKDGLSVEHIQMSGAKAAYVTPSHQFPFGMVLSITKRMKLLNWAYETGSYIIEDDYDSEFRYRGQPIPSLKSLDERERVIYLGTFSKSFLPSARLSYLVLPPSLMVQYSQRFLHYNHAVSPIIQRAVAIFMQSGEFERHIRRMRKMYQRKHQVLLKWIEEFIGAQVDIIGEKSGLHILLKLKNITASELIERGLANGVKVYSPEKFWLYSNQETSSYIMLGFGGLTVEEIEKGVRLLSSCFPTIDEKIDEVNS